MIGIHGGIYSPVRMLVEARGNPSARSSVSINLDQLCNPVVTWLQEKPTSGKYSRLHHVVGDVFSTGCGFGLIPKIIPIRRVNCFTECAETSWRDASSSQNFSTPAPDPPARGFCAAPVLGAAFFCEVSHEVSCTKPTTTDRLDRGWLTAIYV